MKGLNGWICFTIGIGDMIIILVILFFTFIPVEDYGLAIFSGVKIKISILIGMRLRG